MLQLQSIIEVVVNKQNTEILPLFGNDSKTEQEVSCMTNNFMVFMTFIIDIGLFLWFFYGLFAWNIQIRISKLN